MAVIHILKDGSTVEDITGRVVRVKDALPVYQMIGRINQRARVHKEKEKC